MIKLDKGDLKVGDSVKIVDKAGNESTQEVTSMQIEHADIDIAKAKDQFGLKVTELKPALVPFIFSREDLKIFGELSGISINGLIKCNKMEFRGSILFTHRGLSGPAILQISSYWKSGDTIVIDLLPGIDIYGIFILYQHLILDLCIFHFQEHSGVCQQQQSQALLCDH